MKDPVSVNLEIKIEDLPLKYQTLAKIIGLENILKLAKEIGGECFYFPKLDDLYIKQRDRQIIKEFDGHNVNALAKKNGITTYRIYQILRRRTENKRQ